MTIWQWTLPRGVGLADIVRRGGAGPVLPCRRGDEGPGVGALPAGIGRLGAVPAGEHAIEAAVLPGPAAGRHRQPEPGPPAR